MLSLRTAAALTVSLLLHAQNAATPLHFDVASVKVSTQDFLVMTPDRSGGRIHWTTDLWRVIGYAYRMQPWQISGPVPGSVSTYEFDVVTSNETSDDQVRQMFQSLLKDRFGMVAHQETKDADGWALSLAKGGPKMQEAAEGKIPPAPEGLRGDPAKMEGFVPAYITGPGVGNLAGRRVTMQQVTETLQRLLSAKVVDLTGLTAKYYFNIQYATANAPADVTLPDLPAALKELGLKLEKHRGPVPFLTVERIEKIPTDN
jgi:uncharacterized protein (TIGR03435 family)